MVSNFIFKQGPSQEDTWLIDNVSMEIGTKALSKIAEYRWRGKMMLSLRGYNIKNVIRLDYASDYIILLCLFFGLQIAIMGF